MSFAHLHVHSTYSLLDGFSDVKKLVNKVKEMGMSSIALTDHGTMFGAIEFYNAATAAGVKPIIGLEAYMAARRMMDRDGKIDKHSSHLLLLAENQTGYQNLLKIATAAQLDGFYYFPRIDHEFLAKHSEGLIATSGCMAAEIPRAIVTGEMEAVRKKMDWYYDIFGKENFFLELQQHNIKELPMINKALIDLGSRYEARYIATNDVHYINPDDARLQDVLLAVQTGSRLDDPDRFRMDDPSYYLRSPEEMAQIFAEVPEALSNTLLIAERCHVDLEKKGYHLPTFDVPASFTTQSYLRKLCEEGLHRRYGARANDPKIRERLEYELDVIHKMGFDAYFLIVSDLCRYATQEGVWYNARGSAAGSMVAYTLDITLVEPIDHGLIFERFLNPGRIEMPDIDLDFQDDKRAKIMQYCATKYGSDKVAQIITFGTMGARAALRDVARVMSIPIPEVDRIAKMIPTIPGKPMGLLDAVQESPELQEVYSQDSRVRNLIDTASQMEGTVRNAGTHAAGVIIADKPIVEYAPLHRPTNGAEDSPIKSVVQYEMSHVDKLGLLKVDFLGLITLTIMQRACDLIRERHGVDYNLQNIPTDDPETYEFIGKGHTAGVFQLEGSGMTRWLVQMKPRTLANVIAMVALFRPGPMDFIPQYIRRMHGEEEVSYRHPALEPIMKETYGIAIYQEQVMFAAIDLAGYSASEADDLRKAISKKKKEAIEKHREKFVKGAIERGIPKETASGIFEDWENFARYGFNKSHAAEYGVVAVQTAFLKTHYTVEYMTALLSASASQTEKVAEYVADCRAMDIEVLPPDVNFSQWDFSVEDRPDKTPAIRFGLGAVKNIGTAPVSMIVDGRRNTRFTDLTDFAKRVDLRSVGKRSLEGLIKVGALDSLGQRQAMFNALDRIMNVSAAHFRAVESGQMSLFGMGNGVSEEIILPPVRNVDRREILNWEKELIGLYVSAHPLTPYLSYLDKVVTHYAGQLKDITSGEKVIIAGLVTKFRPYQTKTGKPMGFVTVEDVQGEVELVLFPRTWDKCSQTIKIDEVLVVEGKVDNDGSSSKILVDSVQCLKSEDMQGGNSIDGSDSKVAPSAWLQSMPEKRKIKNVIVPPAPHTEVIEPDWETEIPEPDFGFNEISDFPEENADPLSNWMDGDPDLEEITETPKNESPQVKQVFNSLKENTVIYSQKEELGSLKTITGEPIYITPPAAEKDSERKRVVIYIRASGNLDRDLRKMKIIQGTLLSFPGKDYFAFQIFEKGKGTLIEFPNYTTKVCNELLDKLTHVVGPDKFQVEKINIQ